jgi:transcriptional regulator with GAF, ATPase, and Fis domain
MSNVSSLKPEIKSLQDLVLEMASQRSLDVLLDVIVNRLAEQPDVALARIWLLGPGDLCSICRIRKECPDHSVCLHLSATKGTSLVGRDEEWSRTDGQLSRLPIGGYRVGRIALTKAPLEIPDMAKGPPIPHAVPGSFEIEKIVGFSGQPLLYKDELVGVIALFTRAKPMPERFTWLRMIADHAAIAVANARAFQEIEQLKSQLEMENAYLQEELSEVQDWGEIVGQSHALRKVLSQIELVAPTDANVLILGESGTGKELVARAIHQNSARKDRPMIKVNCASIPRDLYESEFFGHVKGAFTGAIKDRAGRFDVADKGTLFLDEVGEIPLDLQSKLLRVLQEGRFEPVGSEITCKVDVRIIAATNRDLRRQVETRRFRQDLYYRLNVFPVEVAPLRDRKEDIPLLASHFFNIFKKAMNRPQLRLSQANLLALQAYDWPGNVRELQNAIERAVILARSNKLTFTLPGDGGEQNGLPANGIWGTDGPADRVLSELDIRQLERENTRAALESCGWKIYGRGGASEMLGLKPTTLATRIKKMGLQRPDKRQ